MQQPMEDTDNMENSRPKLEIHFSKPKYWLTIDSFVHWTVYFFRTDDPTSL